MLCADRVVILDPMDFSTRHRCIFLHVITNDDFPSLPSISLALLPPPPCLFTSRPGAYTTRKSDPEGRTRVCSMTRRDGLGTRKLPWDYVYGDNSNCVLLAEASTFVEIREMGFEAEESGLHTHAHTHIYIYILYIITCTNTDIDYPITTNFRVESPILSFN